MRSTSGPGDSGERGVEASPVEEREAIRFRDPEGLEHELAVSSAEDEPLTAEHPEIPAELALQGFDGVCAYASDPARSSELLGQTLGFTLLNESDAGALWERRGNHRGGFYAYHDRSLRAGNRGRRLGAPRRLGVAGRPARSLARAGVAAGMRPTPVIDRFYFQSVYFREPSGVLFELATLGGPGFAIDEPLESLGEKLSLPPFIEHLRDRIEPELRPVVNPRQALKQA